MPRFAILEHTGAPDDPTGRHYDLLLEAGETCRTWRLAALPVAGDRPVAAVELAPHRLAWLDIVESDVSGGRGHARRVDAGTYEPIGIEADSVASSTCLVLLLGGAVFRGRLRLEVVANGWAASAGDPA